MKLRLFVGFLVFVFSVNAQVGVLTSVKGIPEISGMVRIQGKYWALNDGGNPAVLYQFDTINGNIIDSTKFSNASNIDWEELQANDSFVFIGDFGNNNGTRKDLRIFRFPIAHLGMQNVTVDTLSFLYKNQKTFDTDIFTIYDAEAMLASKDTIWLLSKSKADAKLRIYPLPAKPGNYSLKAIDSLDLNFWVCGVSKLNHSILLVGYQYNITSGVLPWLATFDADFKSNLKQQPITLSLAKQLESAIYLNSTTYLLASEKSNGDEATVYAYKKPNSTNKNIAINTIKLFPNPSRKYIDISIGKKKNVELEITDSSGKWLKSIQLNAPNTRIDLHEFKSGIYYFQFNEKDPNSVWTSLILREKVVIE